MAAIESQTVVISASVVVDPNENLMVASALVSDIPIASNTWLGR